MSRFLVTGAAGFIGSQVSETLVQKGHQVLGVDNFSNYYPRHIKEQNLSSLLQISNFTMLEKSVEHLTDDDVHGCTHIIHLAAQPGVRDSWNSFQTYLNDNLLATNNLLQRTINSGIKRFVTASSSSVYGNQAVYPTKETASLKPRSPYGVTKLALEALSRAYTDDNDLQVLALRFFTVYGPRQRPDMATHRLITAAIKGTQFELFGDGSARRDFTYVDDIVSACELASTCPLGDAFTALNVGGTGDTSMSDLIHLIESVTGETIRLVRRDRQTGDVARTGADCSAAQTLLGWEPKYDLETGIENHVRYLKSALL